MPKELHGRNRESKGVAGMLRLHVLVSPEEESFVGQEREGTSRSPSLPSSSVDKRRRSLPLLFSSSPISACILEPSGEGATALDVQVGERERDRLKEEVHRAREVEM